MALSRSAGDSPSSRTFLTTSGAGVGPVPRPWELLGHRVLFEHWGTILLVLSSLPSFLLQMFIWHQLYIKHCADLSCFNSVYVYKKLLVLYFANGKIEAWNLAATMCCPSQLSYLSGSPGAVADIGRTKGKLKETEILLNSECMLALFWAMFG